MRSLATRAFTPIRRGGEGSSQTGRFLSILGLTGFAISQPLLALLGDEPTWFTFRGASATRIGLAALAIALVPPVVVWAVGFGASLASKRLGWWVHLASIVGLIALFVLQLPGVAGSVHDVALGLAALLVGIGAMVLYASSKAVESWTRYTAVLPAISVAMFVFASPTGELLRPAEPKEAVLESGVDPPSILFVMLDELPTKSLLTDDRTIDAQRFPNLASLAEDGTWFRNYTVSTAATAESVPSLLSGTTPIIEEPLYTNYPDNLFSLLAPTHELQVAESSTKLCAPQLCGSAPASGSLVSLLSDIGDLMVERITAGDSLAEDLGDDFTEGLAPPPVDPLGPVQLRQEPVRQTRILEQMTQHDGPTLWYLHLAVPHHPWRLYPDGRAYEPGPWISATAYPSAVANDGGDWVAATTEQRHLMQLQYADALVGQLLDRLRDEGLYDEAAVVVTADHGVSFETDTHRREVDEQTIDSIAYTPLIVKAPSATEGRIDDSNLTGVDLLPTVAETLGIEIPWEVDGAPAGSLEQQARDQTRTFYDFGSPFGPSDKGTLTFDGVERAPVASDRWVRPSRAGDETLDGVLDLLSIDDQLGRSLASAITQESGTTARLDAADALRTPDPENPPGFVAGYLPDFTAEPDDVLLVAVDDVIVSGSPLIEFGGQSSRFFAPLPPDLLRPDGNTVSVAVRRGDGVLELPIE